jgi:hypothetical protein
VVVDDEDPDRLLRDFRDALVFLRHANPPSSRSEKTVAQI